MSLFKSAVSRNRGDAPELPGARSRASADEPAAFPDRPVCRKLDPQLVALLKELDLYRNQRRFKRKKIQYSDLPLLKPSMRAFLIPDPEARDRFDSHILETFGSITSNEDGEVLRKEDFYWEIDPSDVSFDDPGVQEPESEGEEPTHGDDLKFGLCRLGMNRVKVAVKTVTVRLVEAVDDLSDEEEVDVNDAGKMVHKEDLIRELRRMGRGETSHDNVIKVFGCWFEDVPEEARTVRAHLVMDYCDHIDLWHYRTKIPNLGPLQKIAVLRQICTGMAFLHSKGYIHRGLTLSNILVASDRTTVKISDFFVGMSNRGRKQKIPGTSSPILCGDLLYVCPEIFYKERIENPKQIDIYAFGVLAWTFWTGTLPYGSLRKKADSAVGLLQQIHARDRPLRPSLRRLVDCPQSVKLMIGKCWSARMEVRFEDFGQLVQVLDEAFEELRG